MKKRILFLWFLCGLTGSGIPSLSAVETAKPITDREIVERLTRLEEGQKALLREMEQRFAQVEQRFEQVNQRFAQVDQRFEQMQRTMEQRFTFLENLVMVLIASILGLIGFIVWDRKTALRPLEKKLDRLEQDLAHDLELQRPDGSRLTRLIHALGELAKTDTQVAEALRAFALL